MHAGSNSLRLEEIRNDWGACTACQLHKNRSRPLWGVGNAAAPIMLVVDRHAVADLNGRLMPADSTLYQVLTSLLGYHGAVVSDYWTTCAVLCPEIAVTRDMPDTIPAANVSCVTACRPRLLQEISAVGPEIVIAFGTAAYKALFQKNAPSLLHDVGRVVEASVTGVYTTYNVPVVLSYPLHMLYAQQDFATPGGLWDSVNKHLATAIKIARTLRP